MRPGSKKTFGGPDLTLTKALKIDENLLLRESRSAMLLAERIWQSRGMPREANALTEVLEEILQTCKESGLQYPPILLKRKKQIERGQYFLDPPKASNGECELCHGTGYHATAAGTATLCPCEAWKRQRLSKQADKAQFPST